MACEAMLVSIHWPDDSLLQDSTTPVPADRTNDPMSFPDQTRTAGRSALHDAQAALVRGDLQGADALFLEHVARARGDAAGLAHYGIFCLRTGRAATACYLLSRANALHPGDSEMLCQLGYAMVEIGNFGTAGSSFEAALALSPRHPPANYGLALCLAHESAWSAAVAAFETALALAATSDALPILLKLAGTCARAGDARNALLNFERGEQAAPDNPALLLQFGKFLREQGEPSRAMRVIDRLAARHPGEANVILEKASCLLALGDPAHALRWLQRLEETAPGMPQLQAAIGDCLQARADSGLREMHWLKAIGLWTEAGDFARAELLLDRLLAAHPASAPGWNSRGVLENARGQCNAAEAAYRKAIACDPASLDAPANLANLYENSNRIVEAEAIAGRALPFIRAGQHQTATIELYLTLCKLARRQGDFARARDMLERIDAFGTGELQRPFVGFERGKLMDQLGDAAGAIAAFTLGNADAQATWLRENPGRNKTLAGVEYMLDLVGKGWLRQWIPIASLPAAANITFLVGFPRSGTTLLNQVLGCHSAIQTMEEKPPAQKIMDTVHSMPAGYPHALADLDAFDISYLRDAYFHSMEEHLGPDLSKPGTAQSVSSKLIVDKFPMHLTLAGLLHRVFPQARFVLALRHPCDVVLSCFMQGFDLNNTMANFCTLGDTVALYTRTMDLWEAYRAQLLLVVHTVRYEDVVDDFEGEMRSLCRFLGVAWEDGLQQFATRALDRGRINTPSYAQVSRPIYQEARYRWVRYRKYLAPYLPALRPYIERFGYAEANAGSSAIPASPCA